MKRRETLTLAVPLAAIAGFIVASASASEPHDVGMAGLARDVSHATPTPQPTATPTPQPTATPTAVPTQAPVTSVRNGCPALIVETFGVNAWAACEVAWCESSYNANAVGAASERGWFQVHPIHGVHWERAFDPHYNVTFAYELSNGGADWTHWSCKPW